MTNSSLSYSQLDRFKVKRSNLTNLTPCAGEVGECNARCNCHDTVIDCDRFGKGIIVVPNLRSETVHHCVTDEHEYRSYKSDTRFELEVANDGYDLMYQQYNAGDTQHHATAYRSTCIEHSSNSKQTAELVYHTDQPQ